MKADKWNPGDVYLQISEPEVPSIEEVQKDYFVIEPLKSEALSSPPQS